MCGFYLEKAPVLRDRRDEKRASII